MSPNRRAILGVSALLAAAPRLVSAATVARIGLLVLGSAEQRDAVERNLLAGLGELGYVEGRNLVLERRYADSQLGRLAGFAQEFAQHEVDVIVTTCTPTTRAARGATQRIPIVMVAVADPVGSAFVESLARPGTNVTGRSSQSVDIVSKMLGLFAEVVPKAGSLGVLVNVDNPVQEPLWREAQKAARALELELKRAELRSLRHPRGEDLGPAFERLAAARAGGVFMLPDDPISVINRARIVALAQQHRLPGLYGASEFAESGGLMSYGENLGDSARQSARHVDRLLKGADPAALPVEQPTRFELVVNLRTARALGLTMPGAVLLAADRVID